MNKLAVIVVTFFCKKKLQKYCETISALVSYRDQDWHDDQTCKRKKTTTSLHCLVSRSKLLKKRKPVNRSLKARCNCHINVVSYSAYFNCSGKKSHKCEKKNF